MGYFACFLLQLSTLLTLWRVYVWAKREQARANIAEDELLEMRIAENRRVIRRVAMAQTRRKGELTHGA